MVYYIECRDYCNILFSRTRKKEKISGTEHPKRIQYELNKLYGVVKEKKGELHDQGKKICFHGEECGGARDV